jgi:hypothetical protein
MLTYRGPGAELRVPAHRVIDSRLAHSGHALCFGAPPICIRRSTRAARRSTVSSVTDLSCERPG